MNPLIAQVDRLVADGLHPSNISIERNPAGWTSRIVLDDWGDPDELGSTLRHHVVTIDRDAIPDSVSLKATVRWPDDVIDLPPMSDEQAETLIAEVARVGIAPDWAAFAVPGERPHHWLTKPIRWLREPMRSALLKKYGHEVVV